MRRDIFNMIEWNTKQQLPYPEPYSNTDLADAKSAASSNALVAGPVRT